MNKEMLVHEIKSKYYTMTNFADAMGWSKQRLSQTMKNIHRIRVDQAQEMASVLKLDSKKVIDIFLTK